MKDPKHFVQLLRVKGNGKVDGAVILTPPLDTELQAQQYADWFNTDGNHLRGVAQLAMIVTELDTFAVRIFETTLY